MSKLGALWEKVAILEFRINAALQRHVDHEARIAKLEGMKDAIDWNKMPLRRAGEVKKTEVPLWPPEGGKEGGGE